MNKFKIMLGAVIVCALSACSTPPSETVVKPRGGELSSRTLKPGECGLFVWNKQTRKFILFSQSGQSAVIVKEDEELSLSATRLGESDLYAQIPSQSLVDIEGVTYELSLRKGQDINEGLSYKDGSLQYKDSKNWQRVVPVFGLSFCQPEL